MNRLEISRLDVSAGIKPDEANTSTSPPSDDIRELLSIFEPIIAVQLLFLALVATTVLQYS